jgi:hypothetical protein
MPARGPAAEIGRRKADQVTAAVISDVVDVKDLLSWYLGALVNCVPRYPPSAKSPLRPSGENISKLEDRIVDNGIEIVIAIEPLSASLFDHRRTARS